MDRARDNDLSASRPLRPRPPEDGLDCVLLDDGTLVLTVPPDGLAGLMGELAVRERLQHRHLRPILGLDSSSDGRYHVRVPRLREQRLPAWLALRGRLSVGEAVTVLAPIAGLVASAHEARIAFGGFPLSAIGFDSDWAPMLAACPGAQVLEARSDAELDECALAARDLESLRRTITLVASSCPEPAAQHLLQLAEPDSRVGGVASAVHRQLFEIAIPEPLGEHPCESMGPSHPAARSESAGQRGTDTRRDRTGLLGPRRRARVLEVSGRADGRRHPIRPERLGALARARWRRIPARLRLPAVAALAAATSAGLALLVVPGGAVIAVSAPRTPPPASSVPSEVASSGSVAPTRNSASPPAASGAELLMLVRTLIDRRERCLQTAGTECLSALEQGESEVAKADTRALLEGTPWTAVSAESLRSAGDYGELAVFVSTDTPHTTVLVVRTLQGWRLRAVSRAAG